MKVSDLRIEGCCLNKGNKTELGIRLNDAINKNMPLLDNMTKERQANMAGDHFCPVHTRLSCNEMVHFLKR